MSLDSPTNPGTGGVAYEVIKDVKRLTNKSSGAQRKPEKAGGEETWLLVWALPPPPPVTLGKILDFSLSQLSHVQIENLEPHCTNPWYHYETRIRTMKNITNSPNVRHNSKSLEVTSPSIQLRIRRVGGKMRMDIGERPLWKKLSAL